MAKRKKAYKKSRKNQKKFKRAKRGASLLTNNQGIIMPQRLRTKLVYNVRLVAAGTGQLQILEQFRTNNVYDPDVRTGNYGCHGFRQLATTYDKFICYGSKIHVKAMSNTVASVQNITVLPSAFGLGDVATWNNVDGMKWAKSGKMMSIATGGAPESEVKNSITVQELYGLRKNEAKYDPSLRLKTAGGIVNGVPFKDGYWYIVIRSADADNITDLNVALNVKITYDVEFFDMINHLPPQTLDQEIFELNTANGAPLYGALGVTGATGGAPVFDTTVEQGDDGDVIYFA